MFRCVHNGRYANYCSDCGLKLVRGCRYYICSYSFDCTFATHQGLQLHFAFDALSLRSRCANEKHQIYLHTEWFFDHSKPRTLQLSCIWWLFLSSFLYSVNTSLKVVTARLHCIDDTFFSVLLSFDWRFLKIKISDWLKKTIAEGRSGRADSEAFVADGTRLYQTLMLGFEWLNKKMTCACLFAVTVIHFTVKEKSFEQLVSFKHLCDSFLSWKYTNIFMSALFWKSRVIEVIKIHKSVAQVPSIKKAGNLSKDSLISHH